MKELTEKISILQCLFCHRGTSIISESQLLEAKQNHFIRCFSWALV